ncbi:hypothetical protein CHS0354_003285 [Potamilus streckersoni]|uniref:Uncharacterized protein n=1 Tax=Potamilus streckersoni TaxID=2493646 RepID=A0AAE0SBM3_9BIVA|nr:hypothetical protein CHS0354_003285 [Potamilus streckersoni]
MCSIPIVKATFLTEVIFKNMAMSGQIGVAVSRIKSKKELRMINIRSCLIRNHPQFIKKLFCESPFYPGDKTCWVVPVSVDHLNRPENNQESATDTEKSDGTDDVEENDIENDSDYDEEVIQTMDILESNDSPMPAAINIDVLLDVITYRASPT